MKEYRIFVSTHDYFLSKYIEVKRSKESDIQYISLYKDEEEKVQTSAEKGGEDKLSLWESAKLLFANKYYLIIVAVYVLTYIQTGIAGIGIYYMTYVLGNPALLGTFSAAQMFPMIIGLAFTPWLVKKAKGMYKVNLFGYCIAFL